MTRFLKRLPKGGVWLLVILLAIPAAFTYYAWQITDENVRQSAQAKFAALAFDSERALQYRIDSYRQALLGGTGFLDGSDDVTSAEWKAYVSAVDVTKNFPGINGIGWIEEIQNSEMESFIDLVEQDKGEPFSIHPEVDSDQHFVIRNIEPLEINREAVGLNIAFEQNRYEAAVAARDTGRATITKRILLVQDAEKTPGFLLLQPNYQKGKPLTSVEERRAAFRSWVYAPFIGKNFFRDLTDSQGNILHLQVYDGDQQNSDALIFDSGSGQMAVEDAEHQTLKTIEIMEQTWLLVWSSTPAFEALESSNEPFLILAIGALFTGACGVFLIIMAIRGSEETGMRPSLVLPAMAFVATIGVGVLLSSQFSQNEREALVNSAAKEASSFRKTLMVNVEDRVRALNRMANRWVEEGGSPEPQWRADAKLYVQDQPDLKAVEWVDSSYHVRWVEPLLGNESAVGLNIVFNEERRLALSGAAERNNVTMTPPLDLVQGYKGLITYSPIRINGEFDGFIVGIFGINELMSAVLNKAGGENFVARLSTNGQEFYRSNSEALPVDQDLIRQETIQLYDQTWTLKVFPSAASIASKTSFLSQITLATSIFLAFLISLLIFATQKSKQKTGLVQEKENLLSTFVRHTPAAVAMFDDEVRYIAASDRWYSDYGLEGQNVIGKSHYDIFPEILELQPHWKKLHKRAIDGAIIKSNEEKFTREDGTQEWLRYELHPWSKGNGEKGGLIMFTENITVRKQMDTMKDEFVATVNHELRTPLTSIQAALGLLRVKIGNDLDEKAKRLLFLSYENCKRLTHLVNDILDMEKIASGKPSFQLEDVEMNDLVLSIVDQNMSYADDSNVTFETLTFDDPIYCTLDPHRFNQAMTNVLSNAVKFSRDGGLITISVEHEEETTFRVSVKDRGIGIPKSFQSKVYEKFSQADGSSTRIAGGSGLGLSITKAIIEAFGGEIEMQSDERVGTVFSFILPKNAFQQQERQVA